MSEPETVASIVAECRAWGIDASNAAALWRYMHRLEAAHSREIAEERAQGVGFCDEKDATIAGLQLELKRVGFEAVENATALVGRDATIAELRAEVERLKTILRKQRSSTKEGP